ncbi:Maf-like protein [Marinobacterium nitratireducens]|uniref:7-methyl-GTP pyrophosphatase n=1 Tax=Marinobacterium nitratireducens TaxID=518897 RepID=A0A917ZPP9_9GAMM|nr:Maf family nucleotide pyrophosphatase [Marinobacterium nitratireducens]GGO87091.1 Maf-like protein [Marinobacterium nitratireducens]
MTKNLILGSSSPYRRELLDRLGLEYRCVSPDIDETPNPGEPPEALVQRLALEKARAVAKQADNALIIGSDQVAVLDGSIIGKPLCHDNAVKQLRQASGRAVLFLTGLCLLDSATGEYQLEAVPFRVHFRNLDDAMIERYLRREQPYQCAGSFMSEGLGIALFERLEGDDPNSLIGLPLIRLIRMLEHGGIAIL